MNAELEFYETSLEVDLWTKDTGIQRKLLHDWLKFKTKKPCFCLAPSLTKYIEDDYAEKYGELFMPLLKKD